MLVGLIVLNEEQKSYNILYIFFILMKYTILTRSLYF